MSSKEIPLRVAILTEIISPYRVPMLNELAQQESIDLNVFFFPKLKDGDLGGSQKKIFDSITGCCQVG